jgi:peptidoglycan/LPS O-acetylase OafA/YrhL
VAGETLPDVVTEASPAEPPTVSDRPQPGPAVTAGPSVSVAGGPPAVTAGSPPRPVARGNNWSAEVQALRAIAVMLVVLFHLWPLRVPGGYIGVDVFFVISGFLITGHLLRDLAAGTFRITGFYARRARRLLPASLLVLGISLLGTLLLQPSLVWVQTAQQVLASATYVQNWVLAAQHVDYLNPEISPTVVQHFWSLSVEEQFYLIWPVTLMIATGGWWMRRRTASVGRSRARPAVVIAVMATLFAVSFGYAVQITSSSVEGAYFFSTARVWQFAAGGMLAAVTIAGRNRVVAPNRPDSLVAGRSRADLLLRGSLSWLGFGVIALTGLRFSAETPVPGWPALFPVAATIAVIAVGAVDSPWSPAYLVRLGPTQWLGKVSYSLYLWHWPLIVLAPSLLGRATLRTTDKIALLVLSLVLAGLTKWLIEDRFLAKPASRVAPVAPVASAEAGSQPAKDDVSGGPVPAGGQVSLPPARRKFQWSGAVATIAIAMLVVVSLAGGTWWSTVDQGRNAQDLATRALAAGTPCFGAPAILMTDRCGPDKGDEFVVSGPFGNAVTPAPANAATEIQRTAVWRDCFHTRTPSCTFGPAGASTHVVLFGDSHALQWFPALQEVARVRGWQITTYLKAACPPNPAPMRSKAAARDMGCRRWAERSLNSIKKLPDVDAVIVTAFNSKKWEPAGKLDSYDTGVAGYRDSWDDLLDNGVHKVIAIRDTPRPSKTGIECVEGSEIGGAECSRSREEAIHRTDGWRNRLDPLESAVRESDRPEVGLLDLTNAFCGTDSCPAVIGNVLVYIDDDHISPTYSRTLAPELERRLVKALR